VAIHVQEFGPSLSASRRSDGLARDAVLPSILIEALGAARLILFEHEKAVETQP
jgi:hypothetical protein